MPHPKNARVVFPLLLLPSDANKKGASCMLGRAGLEGAVAVMVLSVTPQQAAAAVSGAWHLL